jgi:hypothetical protein
MENTVLSHIPRLKFLSSLLINLTEISIFTCFILRVFGVLIMKANIKGMCVFSLIIGRIFVENPNYTNILKISVLTGGRKNT